MKRKDSFEIDYAFVWYDDVEKVVSKAPPRVETIIIQAKARRNLALGLALKTVSLSVPKAWRACREAVDQAFRLRALASRTDRQLASRGLCRADLPGLIYGWHAPLDVGSFKASPEMPEPANTDGPHRKAA